MVGLSDVDNIRLVVALSGGADSVALLRALLELGYTCTAAHCNFHLRGDESMRDERFVRDLCQKLGVELHVKDFDVQIEKTFHGGSIEMACRKLRYDWFCELQRQMHCLIVVAHHFDDNVETFFLNLFRGTGIHGLVGMSPRVSGIKWPEIVRPMLGVTRAQILHYLDAVGQNYVYDSTNSENIYKRNRLRNVILPEIDKQFPDARQRVVDTMSHLAEECRLLDSLLDALWLNYVHVDDQLAEERHCETFIPREMGVLFQRFDGMLLYSLLKRQGYNFNRFQCEQAANAPVGAKFISGSYTLTVCRDGFEIQQSTESISCELNVDLRDPSSAKDFIEVSLDNPPFSPAMVDGGSRVAFNNQLLQCKRVVLRKWRQGDRIRPFGMRGSKLVSDLFVDLKLSSGLKKAVWLMEADGEIVWVLGYRAAQAFVVQPGSTDYVLLKYS